MKEERTEGKHTARTSADIHVHGSTAVVLGKRVRKEGRKEGKENREEDSEDVPLGMGFAPWGEVCV